jgi:transposase InsO family protein
MSHIKPVIAAKPFTLASYSPWDKLNIDAMGPFPETSEGYQHIIVVIDCFTRFVELFPVKSTSAAEATRAILSVIGRYGIPNTITTDGGSQFKNSTIQSLIESLGVEHNITMAYSKEENAMVERANKEVLRHLAAMVYETRITNEWIDFLPHKKKIT